MSCTSLECNIQGFLRTLLFSFLKKNEPGRKEEINIPSLTSVRTEPRPVFKRLLAFFLHGFCQLCCSSKVFHTINIYQEKRKLVMVEGGLYSTSKHKENSQEEKE